MNSIHAALKTNILFENRKRNFRTFIIPILRTWTKMMGLKHISLHFFAYWKSISFECMCSDILDLNFLITKYLILTILGMEAIFYTAYSNISTAHNWSHLLLCSVWTQIRLLQWGSVIWVYTVCMQVKINLLQKRKTIQQTYSMQSYMGDFYNFQFRLPLMDFTDLSFKP